MSNIGQCPLRLPSVPVWSSVGCAAMSCAAMSNRSRGVTGHAAASS